jgi:uncharacterized protein involved in exopolysaccharide biosynthesis
MTDQSEFPVSAAPELVMNAIATARVRVDRELFSLAALGSVPLRHLRLMIVTPSVVAALIVSVGVLLARYTSESQFTTAIAGSNVQGLSGVAAQFGISVRNLSGGQSVDFYAALVQSRDMLTKAVETLYRFPTDAGARDTVSGTLLQLYRVSADTHADSVLRAVEVLRKRLDIDVDETANTVTINVSADWPLLAEQINGVLLDQVNMFNVDELKSQASAERHFIEGRMREAQSELDSAEDRLRTFLEKNRTYQTSPRLQFDVQRLQAQVELRRQVYTTLAQSYEQARIAEVRETPVVTVIDAPKGSAIRHRHIVRNGILGLLFGFALGIGLAFGMEYVQQERVRNPEDYSEFARLRRAAWQRIASLVRRARRRTQRVGEP